MTKEQLKTLGTIPSVLEALKALASEIQQMNQLMATVGMAAQVHPPHPPAYPSPAPRATPQAPTGFINIDTPEREEYRQSLKPVPKLKALEQLPAGQRRAIELGYLAQVDGERAQKMAQFKHDAPVEGQGAPPAVEAEQITSMSEAT